MHIHTNIPHAFSGLEKDWIGIWAMQAIRILSVIGNSSHHKEYIPNPCFTFASYYYQLKHTNSVSGDWSWHQTSLFFLYTWEDKLPTHSPMISTPSTQVFFKILYHSCFLLLSKEQDMDWWSTLYPQCLLRLMLLREMSLFPLLSLTCLPAVCPRAAFKSLPGSSQETTNRCYPSLTAFALLDNTPSVVNISFVTSGSCFFLLVFIAKPLRECRRKLRNWDFGVNTLSLCEGGKEQRSEWKTGRHKGKNWRTNVCFLLQHFQLDATDMGLRISCGFWAQSQSSSLKTCTTFDFSAHLLLFPFLFLEAAYVHFDFQ